MEKPVQTHEEAVGSARKAERITRLEKAMHTQKCHRKKMGIEQNITASVWHAGRRVTNESDDLRTSPPTYARVPSSDALVFSSDARVLIRDRSRRPRRSNECCAPAVNLP
eukprot:5898510-Pleurochrysis_carterae.AAC.2